MSSKSSTIEMIQVERDETKQPAFLLCQQPKENSKFQKQKIQILFFKRISQ